MRNVFPPFENCCAIVRISAAARWYEFEGLDGPEPIWRIPAARMKGDANRKAEGDGDHLLPLAHQSVELLKALHLVTGRLDLLFPSEWHFHKQMSENRLRALFIRAGYHQRHVPHGFRATFSTMMNEHCKEAGDRAAYMARPRQIAQVWADMLLKGMPTPATFLRQPERWASNARRAVAAA